MRTAVLQCFAKRGNAGLQRSDEFHLIALPNHRLAGLVAAVIFRLFQLCQFVRYAGRDDAFHVGAIEASDQRTDGGDAERAAELRAELSQRAEQNVRSEVKLREVETELSVAQASTDMIATGVLDYSLAPDADDDDDRRAAGVSKAAT